MLTNKIKFDPKISLFIDPSININNDLLFEKIWIDLNLNPRQYKTRYYEALKCILANIKKSIRSEKCIMYSRDKGHKNSSGVYINYYKNCSGPEFYTYVIMTTVIDALIEKNYINNNKGYIYFGHSEYPHCSCFSPTDTTIELFAETKPTIQYTPSGNFIKLKNDNNEFISFNPTSKIRTEVEFLKNYFQLRTNTNITLDDELIEPHETYRIYSNDFTEEGRFYGELVQTLTKQERKNLKINGNNTREYDVKSMFINLLLNKEGLPCSSTIYNIPGNHREFVKFIILTSLNCKPGRLVRSVQSRIEKELQKKNPNPVIKTFPKDKQVIKQLYDNFLKEYPMLEKYTSTSAGKKLMLQESNIASDVLKHFLNKNILVICLHDSFICEEQYMKELETVIMESYKKSTGFYPILELKEYNQ